jgi:hypothetical protein
MENPTDTWLVFQGTDFKYRISAGRKVQQVHANGSLSWLLTTLVRPGETICNLEGQKLDQKFLVIGILSQGALQYWKTHTVEHMTVEAGGIGISLGAGDD